MCPVCGEAGGFHDEKIHGEHVVPVEKLLDGPRFYAHQIEFLRTLNGKELEREVMRRNWFVQPDDLIGGWCIMPINQPPSSGCFEVASFMSKIAAEHVVFLHNRVLRGED